MHEKIENGVFVKSGVKKIGADLVKPSFTKKSWIEKEVESKIKKSLLLKFFENEKMTKKKILKKYRKKKMVIFWNLKKVDSKFFLNLLSKKKCMHEKIENGVFVKSGVKKIGADLVKPSFTKKSWIEKEVESKIKKSLLLKFFENEKVTKKKMLKRVILRKKKFVIFWNLKKVNSKFFLILLSTFFSMHEKIENGGKAKSDVSILLSTLSKKNFYFQLGKIQVFFFSHFLILKKI